MEGRGKAVKETFFNFMSDFEVVSPLNSIKIIKAYYGWHVDPTQFYIVSTTHIQPGPGCEQPIPPLILVFTQ